MQLAAWIAMLSVLFQQYDDLLDPRSVIFMAGNALMVLGVTLYLSDEWRKTATWLFVIGLLVHFTPYWYTAANHSWLAVWTLAPLILFTRWWDEVAYSTYLRYTLGMVMIAAGLQKVVAGTYFDGSYVAWMSYYGSTTEQAFGFLCSGSGQEICGWYVFMGIAVTLWQLAVGVLLLLGLRGWLFYVIEFGFLLAVGLLADEMNFQVLNIALFLIVFRFGMPLWVALGCIAFLWIDIIGVGGLIELVL